MDATSFEREMIGVVCGANAAGDCDGGRAVNSLWKGQDHHHQNDQPRGDELHIFLPCYQRLSDYRQNIVPFWLVAQKPSIVFKMIE